MTLPAPKILLLIAFLTALAVQPRLAAAQDFGFEPPADATDPALLAALSDLAERVLPAYQEDDPDRYLSTVAALQMVVGDPAAAHATRLSLQERLQSEQGSLPGGRAVVYDIYAHARAIEATESIPFRRRIRPGIPGADESPRRSRRLRAGRLVQHTDRAAAGKAPA